MANINPNELPPLDLTGLDEELRKEQAYGDSPVEAFAGEALNTATFGISDAALVAAGVDPERLREARERSPVAAGLGTAAGIAVPAAAALVTGGAAVPAEIAAAEAAKAAVKPTIAKTIAKGLAAPIRALEPVGSAAEKLVAKGLPTSFSPGAREIAKMMARGSAEGALIGTGEGISEIAKGERDFTAESLLQAAGGGALLGAGFGGTVGGLTLGGKKAFEATGRVGQGAKRILSESLEFLNEELPYSVTGGTIAKQQRIAEKLEAEPLAKYLKNDLGYDIADTNKSLKRKNDAMIKRAGADVDLVDQKVDALISQNGSPVDRREVYQKLIDKVQQERANVAVGDEVASGQLSQLDDFEKNLIRRRDAAIEVGKRSEAETLQMAEREKLIKRKLELIDKLSPTGENLAPSLVSERKLLQSELEQLQKARKTVNTVPAPFSAVEFEQLRRLYQSFAYHEGTTLSSFKANVARDLRNLMRAETDNIVSKLEPLSPGLQAEHASAYNRYHFAKSLERPLNDAAARQPNLTTPFAFAVSTAGRLAKNAAFIYDWGQKATKTKNLIATTIEGAFTGKGKAAKLQPAAVNAFIRTNWAVAANGTKPKTPQQAYENIKTNLDTITENPETFIDQLAKKTAGVSRVSPETGAALQQRLATTVQFLKSKLPRPATNPGLFSRTYTPSSMEIAKFGRYVQVAENPLSALEELKRGTLTREHVEALQAVAPEMYKLIQQEAMKYLGTPGLKLPYEKKLQLGILLNVPADSALQPQNLLQLQQNLQQQPEQQQPGPQFRPSAMEQTGMSSRLSTGTEKVAKR